jgi:hypothetical protein
MGGAGMGGRGGGGGGGGHFGQNQEASIPIELWVKAKVASGN